MLIAYSNIAFTNLLLLFLKNNGQCCPKIVKYCYLLIILKTLILGDFHENYIFKSYYYNTFHLR